IWTVLIILAVAAPAIILHEVAHGWMASRLGDGTAREAGRLTLNPLKHIDPFGTVVLPVLLYLPYLLGWSSGLFLFGYAKPVPVDPRRFHSPRMGMMLVRLAGPLTNLLIAFFCAKAALAIGPGPLSRVLVLSTMFNLGLALFNLIPIPPLDGSGIWYAILPPQALRVVARFDNMSGILVVFVLLQLGWLDFIGGFIAGGMRLLGL
ncbi:MAG: site-2 protease family protein, partial [Elusimicrobia bacterium]|nr:site-2 protease family protein [Elusimicrobiota bacterium]